MAKQNFKGKTILLVFDLGGTFDNKSEKLGDLEKIITKLEKNTGCIVEISFLSGASNSEFAKIVNNLERFYPKIFSRIGESSIDGTIVNSHLETCEHLKSTKKDTEYFKYEEMDRIIRGCGVAGMAGIMFFGNSMQDAPGFNIIYKKGERLPLGSFGVVVKNDVINDRNKPMGVDYVSRKPGVEGCIDGMEKYLEIIKNIER